MASPSPSPPIEPFAARSVALVGIGRIGAGWAAWFLAQGYTVTAFDAGCDGSTAAREAIIDRIRTAVKPLIARGASKLMLQHSEDKHADSLFTHFKLVTDMGAAVADAHMVVESVFEALPVKIAVLESISHHAPADCIIGSSTSFLPLSVISCRCMHPARVVIAHPAQPQISRFVELYGTDEQVMVRARRFFEDGGLHPVRLLKENPGHAFNQLIGDGFKSLLDMLGRGVASPMDLDRTFLEVHGVPASVLALEIGGGTVEGFLSLVGMIAKNEGPMRACNFVSWCLGANAVSSLVNRTLVLPVTTACIRPFEGLLARGIAWRTRPLVKQMKMMQQVEGYHELLFTALRRREETTMMFLKTFAEMQTPAQPKSKL